MVEASVNNLGGKEVTQRPRIVLHLELQWVIFPVAYLDFFVALFAEIASPSGHLCTSHSLLFGSKVLLGLDL